LEAGGVVFVGGGAKGGGHRVEGNGRRVGEMLALTGDCRLRIQVILFNFENY
jgi:hypothetical protein